MHYIQQAIIKSLATLDSARYSIIKPKTMESNHFLYHLKQLINANLVVKNSDGAYSITTHGEAFIDGVSFSNFKVRSQPNVLNLLVVRTTDNRYLLYKRKHRPFIGLKGFPYGKIHLGSSLAKSCTIELYDSTGIKAVFAHRGDVYITIFESDILVTHTLFHIHTATVTDKILAGSASYGQFSWETVDLDNPDAYFHGFIEILELTLPKNKTNRFFQELVYRL